MIEDKSYCASAYLTFRFIQDENRNFSKNCTHRVFKPKKNLIPCKNVQDIDNALKKNIEKEFIQNKTAILLSGGVDSAILASYVPKGTTAYTFKCVADGATDETGLAKKYCDIYGLKHQIIEMYWSDFQELTPKIIKDAGVPVHSIEIQLYKAGFQIKNDGFEKIMHGASADLKFGGMDKLLSKDWFFNDWIKRYTFVEPELVLKTAVTMLPIFNHYKVNDKVDLMNFLSEISLIELETTYMHAFSMVNMAYFDPYSLLEMSIPLDLQRVRNGEPKYLLRELFSTKYPTLEIPKKIPMPRATEQWLSDWKGPKRNEFKPNCINGFTGDQKWLVYCLENFFELLDL